MHRSRWILIVVAIIAGCSSNSPDTASTTASRASTSSTATPDTTTTTSDTGPSSTTWAPTPDRAASDIEAIKLVLTPVASDLDSPVAATTRGEAPFLYVAEQHTGRVMAVALADTTDGRASLVAPRVVLDLQGRVAQGNEQGLLGLAFSPDGAVMYVHYNDPAGDTHIDAYDIDNAGSAIESTRRSILTQDQPFPNHNGGQLATDAQGSLYIALGDGGLAADPLGSGQDRNSLLGKILRIDPTRSGAAPYTIPNDNPFAQSDGARPEVLHYGLRNPWRFSFDLATNELWIADVGQNEYEEVNRVDASATGVNFGWNRREGLHAFNGGGRPDGAVDPVHEYSHDGGNCSVTGGYVYRGKRVPALYGVYVFSDFCAGNLIGINAGRGASLPAGSLHAHVDQPTSFAQTPDGEMYVLSRDGTIFAITSGA